MNVWPEIKFFNKRENWGKPDLIDPKLLLILDAYRDELGIALYVSKGVSPVGSHDAENSSHYIQDQTGYAHAVDLIPLLSQGSSITLFDCFLLATRYPFSGLGLYPHWRLSRIEGKGKLVEIGGLHLDTYPGRALPAYRAAGQWIGMPGKGFNHEYFGVTRCNLKKCGLI